jgi:high-affinity Fe2+/Pb2+ permease
MKNENKYTFLEWVFEKIGLAKFLIYFYFLLLLISTGVLTFVWWLTKR